MTTPATLREYTVKDLGQMAKKEGVAGWHSMRKDQLIRTLVRLARASQASKSSKSGKARSSTRSTKAKTRNTKLSSKVAAKAKPSTARTKKKAAKPAKPANTRVARKIAREHNKTKGSKDLSAAPQKNTSNGKPKRRSDRAAFVPNGVGKDRIVLMVRDAYWLQACWEVSRTSVERAKAAMAEMWHTCKPTLRVFCVEETNKTSAVESIERDIEIHGGVNNWYIDVVHPPRSFRVEIGYLSANGKFYSLARSNKVGTPQPGAADSIDENWTDVAENYEKIYAQSGGADDDNDVGDLRELFEERLRRPMGSPVVTGYGVGAERLLHRDRDMLFEVDAELIIFGKTKPDSHVSLAGEPIKLRGDGTFTVRLSMPDRRQVLPVVASSPDGVEQRTIVLAVERNTKAMEPITRESGD
ncbi:MAG: DUF4912 domain-containing protein [Pirellulaceae bacterium]|nr:DUF4912 domain-containing protein [Pirellulaceae bacterium]MDP7014852.1 DUF4912 domain-containing protein [Pirellulaceae bacterium]